MNYRSMTLEQRIAWGRREAAELRNGRPKSHQELIAAIEAAGIRRRAIGATTANAEQMISEADEAGRRMFALVEQVKDHVRPHQPDPEAVAEGLAQIIFEAINPGKVWTYQSTDVRNAYWSAGQAAKEFLK